MISKLAKQGLNKLKYSLSFSHKMDKGGMNVDLVKRDFHFD